MDCSKPLYRFTRMPSKEEMRKWPEEKINAAMEWMNGAMANRRVTFRKEQQEASKKMAELCSISAEMQLSLRKLKNDKHQLWTDPMYNLDEIENAVKTGIHEVLVPDVDGFNVDDPVLVNICKAVQTLKTDTTEMSNEQVQELILRDDYHQAQIRYKKNKFNETQEKRRERLSGYTQNEKEFWLKEWENGRVSSQNANPSNPSQASSAGTGKSNDGNIMSTSKADTGLFYVNIKN